MTLADEIAAALADAMDALHDACADVEPRSWASSRKAEVECEAAILRYGDLREKMGREEAKKGL